MYPYKCHATHEILENLDNIEATDSLTRHRPDHRPDHRPGHRPLPEHRPIPPAPVMPGKSPGFRPPKTIPRRDHNAFRMNPGALKRCEGSMVYLWMRNGRDLWMNITYVGPRTVYGYTWTRLGWVYTGFDTDLIDAFHCFI
ncbi:MAG: hypothetical protein FWE91_03950 [Defluviitaleaceae bacterium]|nr:hypothetical protein [Defluviitaleaceae bacterium]MCL2837265.1 hypothetical protein [Defluviitaleaceae bacterium]